MCVYTGRLLCTVHLPHLLKPPLLLLFLTPRLLLRLHLPLLPLLLLPLLLLLLLLLLLPPLLQRVSHAREIAAVLVHETLRFSCVVLCINAFHETLRLSCVVLCINALHQFLQLSCIVLTLQLKCIVLCCIVLHSTLQCSITRYRWRAGWRAGWSGVGRVRAHTLLTPSTIAWWAVASTAHTSATTSWILPG